MVQYSYAVGRGPEIQVDELPPELRFEPSRGSPQPMLGARRNGEKERIREALQLAGGRVGDAASRLGMSRSTFWRKRRKYGV